MRETGMAMEGVGEGEWYWCKFTKAIKKRT